ncbi:MAG: DUF6273 domain-containing protein [Oscillospiraceae bacterium]|nr:DUF6273 domain-containing protein [Oscillospiraceae bacterium]
MQAGDKIVFGEYNWRVLDIQNNIALIITDTIIETRSYHDRYTDITWADCALRKYLNSAFYNRFTEDEKSRIVPVINKNPDNQWYGTKGGENTQDYIFLLSLEEAVCKYFGDSSAKLYNRNPKHKYWFESKDENNGKRGTTFNGSANSYWLRTPGRISVKAVYIKGNPSGCVGIQGNNVLEGNVSETDYFGGVRPALWLNLYN